MEMVVPNGLDNGVEWCNALQLIAPYVLSSGPEDFHLRALPEPYVNLSIHTAPVVRPFP